MTITSIAKRLGIVTAALQVAARRIIESASDRDPVISLAITKDDVWLVENHGRGIAYDLQVQPIEFLGIKATFPIIPVVFSHAAQIRPKLSAIGEESAYARSISPLSRRQHDIREIVSRQWHEANRHSDTPTREQACPVTLKYRNGDGWHFTVTADIVLRIGSGELSVLNIRTGEREECSPVSI